MDGNGIARFKELCMLAWQVMWKWFAGLGICVLQGVCKPIVMSLIEAG